MKHAQRQYAIKRLTDIHNVKAAAITAAHTTSELARTDAMLEVHPQYPDANLIMQKVLGENNSVELKDDYLELLKTIQWTGYVYCQHIQQAAKPTNQAALDAWNIYKGQKDERHKVQVTDKLERLKAKLIECQDALYLGGEEQALAALTTFQNFEV